MEKRISSEDERRLTHSIEKAASLALVDDVSDKSSLLAKCLVGDGIDSRFSKVASAAFNKRLSVLKFQHTPDEQRAASFTIANPDKVCELMGGAVQRKTASAVSPAPGSFSIRISSLDRLNKTAAGKNADVRYVSYEERVDKGTYERHLLSIMEKMAAVHQEKLGELRTMEGNLGRLAEELRGKLEKTASFTLQTLFNLHGDKIAEIIPAGMALTKTARAVDPGRGVFSEVAAFLDKKAAYTEARNALADFQSLVDDFSRGAAVIGNRLHKTAGVGTLGIIAGRTLQGLGIGAANAVADSLGEARKAYNANLQNAMLMDAAAGRNYDSPAKLMDSELIMDEKLADHVVALSDLLADPRIASAVNDDPVMAFNALNSELQHKGMSDLANRSTLKALAMQRILERNKDNLATEAARAKITADLNKDNQATTIEKGVAAVNNTSGKEDPGSSLLDSLNNPIPEVSRDFGSKNEKLFTKLHDANKASIIEMLDNDGKRRAAKKEDEKEAAKAAETDRQKEDNKQQRQQALEEAQKERTSRESIAAADRKSRESIADKDRESRFKQFEVGNKTYRDWLASQLLLARQGKTAPQRPLPPPAGSYNTENKRRPEDSSGQRARKDNKK